MANHQILFRQVINSQKVYSGSIGEADPELVSIIPTHKLGRSDDRNPYVDGQRLANVTSRHMGTKVYGDR